MPIVIEGVSMKTYSDWLKIKNEINYRWYDRKFTTFCFDSYMNDLEKDSELF